MAMIVAQSGVKLPSDQVSKILNGGRPLSEKSWAEWFLSFFSQLLKHKTARSELESIYQKINVYVDDDSDITQLEKVDNYLTLMQLTKNEYLENYNLVYTKRSDNMVDVDFRYQDVSLFSITVNEESLVYKTIIENFGYSGRLGRNKLSEYVNQLNGLINGFVLDEIDNKNSERDVKYALQFNNGDLSNNSVNNDMESLDKICSILLDLERKDKIDYQLSFYKHDDYSFFKHQTMTVYRAELLVDGRAVYSKVKGIQKRVFDVIKSEFVRQHQGMDESDSRCLLVTLNNLLNVGCFIENTKSQLMKNNLVYLPLDDCSYYDSASCLYSAISDFINEKVNKLVKRSLSIYHYFSDKKIKNYQYMNNRTVDIKTLTVLGDEFYEQIDSVRRHFYPSLVEIHNCNEGQDSCLFLPLMVYIGEAIDILHGNIGGLLKEISNYRDQYGKDDVFFLTKDKYCELSLKFSDMVEYYHDLCRTLQRLTCKIN